MLENKRAREREEKRKRVRERRRERRREIWYICKNNAEIEQSSSIHRLKMKKKMI